jgi:hypothetical protein
MVTETSAEASTQGLLEAMIPSNNEQGIYPIMGYLIPFVQIV